MMCSVSDLKKKIIGTVEEIASCTICLKMKRYEATKLWFDRKNPEDALGRTCKKWRVFGENINKKNI